MMNPIVVGSIAAVSLLAVTGCQMCTDPIAGDPSCVEETHIRGISVMPEVVDYSKPVILQTKDAFRPCYRAGEKRISAVGAGNSLEDATADAVSKLLNENKCDYIVAVTRVITKKTHPAGFFRFFSTTNYSVSISGLPVYLDSLKKETVPEPPPVPYKPCNCKPTPPPPPTPTAKPAPYALLNLTDINLSMTAKGATKDPVAVAVPAPRCQKEKK